jgi:hypothetical protein
MVSSGLPQKTAENILAKFSGLKSKWLEFVDNSFLSAEMKDKFKALIESRFSQLSR